jgi:hypothetical protein
LTDEAHGHVQALFRNPGNARAGREPLGPSPEVAGEHRRCRGNVRIDFDGNE